MIKYISFLIPQDHNMCFVQGDLDFNFKPVVQPTVLLFFYTTNFSIPWQNIKAKRYVLPAAILDLIGSYSSYIFILQIEDLVKINTSCLKE